MVQSCLGPLLLLLVLVSTGTARHNYEDHCQDKELDVSPLALAGKLGKEKAWPGSDIVVAKVPCNHLSTFMC